MVLLEKVELQAVLLIIVFVMLVDDEQNHKVHKEELSFVVGMSATSVCEAGVDRTAVESVRGENRRISDIGEEEAWNKLCLYCFQKEDSYIHT